jgi:hypothetical protein
MISLFKKAVLIVAHPDDEILWFSSILPYVKSALICYVDYEPRPELTANRRQLLAHYPLSHVQSLYLPETNSFNLASWPNPVISGFGLELSNNQAAVRYKMSYQLLKDYLWDYLLEYLEGCGMVVTHNPWGEYGHEDHVQVFRVLTFLQKKLGFRLWVSSYYSKKSQSLVRRYHWEGKEKVTLTVPCEQNLKLMKLYNDFGCWTWHQDWKWPEKETFYCSSGFKYPGLSQNFSPGLQGVHFMEVNE